MRVDGTIDLRIISPPGYTDAYVSSVGRNEMIAAAVKVDIRGAGSFPFTVQVFDTMGNASNALTIAPRGAPEEEVPDAAEDRSDAPASWRCQSALRPRSSQDECLSRFGESLRRTVRKYERTVAILNRSRTFVPSYIRTLFPYGSVWFENSQFLPLRPSTTGSEPSTCSFLMRFGESLRRKTRPEPHQSL